MVAPSVKLVSQPPPGCRFDIVICLNILEISSTHSDLKPLTLKIFFFDMKNLNNLENFTLFIHVPISLSTYIR